jgi:hypothetical protein
MLLGMFVVTEAEVAAIRVVYEQRGELSAAVELRRRFPVWHTRRTTTLQRSAGKPLISLEPRKKILSELFTTWN